MALPSITFCPGSAGCLMHFGTDRNQGPAYRHSSLSLCTCVCVFVLWLRVCTYTYCVTDSCVEIAVFYSHVTTFLHVWYDSFMGLSRAPWLIRMGAMTNSCVIPLLYTWHVSFLEPSDFSWLLPMSDMTHSYAWHDSLIVWSPFFRRDMNLLWDY